MLDAPWLRYGKGALAGHFPRIPLFRGYRPASKIFNIPRVAYARLAQTRYDLLDERRLRVERGEVSGDARYRKCLDIEISRSSPEF